MFCSGQPGIIALAGRAACSAGAPLSLQRKRWERKPRGGIPPSGLPQNAPRPPSGCGGISLPWRGQFQAFRLSGKRCTLPIWGGPRKGRPFGGEWRGEREVPLSFFSFPGFFSRKEIGRCPRRTPARRAHLRRGPCRAGRPSGEDTTPGNPRQEIPAGGFLLSQTKSDLRYKG